MRRSSLRPTNHAPARWRQQARICGYVPSPIGAFNAAFVGDGPPLAHAAIPETEPRLVTPPSRGSREKRPRFSRRGGRPRVADGPLSAWPFGGPPSEKGRGRPFSTPPRGGSDRKRKCPTLQRKPPPHASLIHRRVQDGRGQARDKPRLYGVPCRVCRCVQSRKDATVALGPSGEALHADRDIHLRHRVCNAH